MTRYQKSPYRRQRQAMPGCTARRDLRPDRGGTIYKAGRQQGERAVITGGDSGIGRAVAIAFTRENADFLIAYLEESGDAGVAAPIQKEGRRAVLVDGDLRSANLCQAVVDREVQEFGGVAILVSNRDRPRNAA